MNIKAKQATRPAQAHAELFPLLLAAALLAACGGTTAPYRAPTPQSSTAMPSGSALMPWSASDPTTARPAAMALLSPDHVYVSLNNLDANYAPGGPGIVVALQPSTGATTPLNLGGTTGHDCTNAGALKLDSGKLYVTCTGSYASASGTPALGRQVVELNTTTNVISRTVKAPLDFQPSSIAVTPNKIWVGDASTARIYSIDRQTFAVVDGADPSHPIALPCASLSVNMYASVPDLAYVNGDLFALCSATDGYIVQLDANTGAVKGQEQLVGSIPVAIALTGSGELAISNSVSATVSLVTLSAAGMTVQKDVVKFAGTANLQGIAARDNFFFVVAAATNNVDKYDLAQQPPKLVSEKSTGDNTSPLAILPLDDNQVLVTNYTTGTVVGLDFSK